MRNKERKVASERRMGFSPKEVADLYGLSLSFVRHEICAGRLKCKRAGRRVIILRRDLHRYFNGTGA